MFYVFKNYKKKFIINFLKKEKIFFFRLFNFFYIYDIEKLHFLIDPKIINLSNDSMFFKENLLFISDLYLNYNSKNFKLLKIKYFFEKEHNMFKIDFEKKYEYYLFKIKHINEDNVYFFYSYDNIEIIKEELNIFLNKKLKMSKERFENIKKQIIDNYLSGYDLSFENYIFDLETEDDFIYTALFENINSGKLITIKNIKINKFGEITNAGEKNNELTL